MRPYLRPTGLEAHTTSFQRLFKAAKLSRSFGSLNECVWKIETWNYNHISKGPISLTHWGRMTHICVGKLTIIESDNGLLPDRRQAIIWTNAGILLIGPLGTNFSEILIEIHAFSFRTMHLKMSSGKWRPFCLGLNVLILRMTKKSPVCHWWH